MEDSKLVAYLSQELTAEEAAQVEAWAAQSDENRQNMEQVYYLMQLAQRADNYAKSASPAISRRMIPSTRCYVPWR